MFEYATHDCVYVHVHSQGSNHSNRPWVRLPLPVQMCGCHIVISELKVCRGTVYKKCGGGGGGGGRGGASSYCLVEC